MMDFDKIAELAGDITVSEENMERALTECKKIYIEEKNSKPWQLRTQLLSLPNQTHS